MEGQDAKTMVFSIENNKQKSMIAWTKPLHGFGCFCIIYLLFHIPFFYQWLLQFARDSIFFFQLLLLLNKKYKASIPTSDPLKYCKAISAMWWNLTCIHFFCVQIFRRFFFIQFRLAIDEIRAIQFHQNAFPIFCSVSLFVAFVKEKNSRALPIVCYQIHLKIHNNAFVSVNEKCLTFYCHTPCICSHQVWLQLTQLLMKCAYIKFNNNWDSCVSSFHFLMFDVNEIILHTFDTINVRRSHIITQLVVSLA